MHTRCYRALGIAAAVVLISWPAIGWPDIRDIDFRNMDYPAGQCQEDTGISATVTVRNGEFSEETQGGKASFKIIGDVLYRDLTGDGRDEAVVTARCTLEGAESETTQLYVFSIAGAKPVLLGRIDPAGMLRDYQRYYSDGKVLWQVDRVETKDGLLLLATSADGGPDKPEWHVSMAYRWDGKTLTVATKPERQAPERREPSRIALGTTQVQGAAPSAPTGSTLGESRQGESRQGESKQGESTQGEIKPPAMQRPSVGPADKQGGASLTLTEREEASGLPYEPKPSVSRPFAQAQPPAISPRTPPSQPPVQQESGAVPPAGQQPAAESVKPSAESPPLASQPGRITVIAGVCLCGEQSGGFDATYQGRTVDVGFLRGAAPPASAPGQPLIQPLKVLAGQRELKDEEWRGLICKQGEEPQPCAITGKTVEIEGQWDGSEAFTAQVLYLSQEAQGGQKPIGETAGPGLREQATYVPTPSVPAVSPPPAEAPPPTSPPAAPVAMPSPSLPPGQLGPQLVREMLAYARDNAGIGHEEEIRGTKKRIDWLPSPLAVNQEKARKANERGQAQLRAGRLKEAVKTLEQALAADPGDVEILNNLGYAYFRRGDLDQAERYMISALTISPARAPVWANLGQIYAKKGDIPNAVASFVNSYRFSKNRLKTQQFFQQLSGKERDPKVKQALRESMQLAREHLMSAGRD